MTRRLIVHAYGAADPDTLTTALRVARHSAQGLGKDVEIQIVVQGSAVRLLTKDTTYGEELATTAASGPIKVIACENSMKSASVDPGEMLPLIGSVPSAVTYIAQQQWDGAAYARF
jgi:intracellular sulfur oxidation DsrE/DsrF family protein